MKKDFHYVRCVLTSFIVSRLFVAFGVFIGRKFLFFAPAFQNEIIEGAWWKSLVRYDANFYINVAVNGYNFLPDGKTYNVDFFPLYPLLIKGVAHIFNVSSVMSGLVLSNLFFLAALLLLYRYTEEYHHDADPGLAVLLMAFYPFGVFFASVYNESLFLFLTVLAFALFRSVKMIASACALSLMGSARLAGLFVTAAMGLSHLFSRVLRFDKKRPQVDTGELLSLMLWGLLSVSGFLLFVLYQQLIFGHWDAFIKAQAAFDRHPIGSFSALIPEMDLDPYHIMNILPAATVFGLSIVFLFLRDYRLYSLWGFLAVLIPLSTGTFASMTRFTMVFFPLVIFDSYLLKKTAFLRDITIMAFSSALIVFSALFVRSYFLG
jgi:hypothetical protein